VAALPAPQISCGCHPQAEDPFDIERGAGEDEERADGGETRQANIAHGPQQVNNGMPLARAENPESVPNKLLGDHGERLDNRATTAASDGHPALVPMEPIHRPADRKRQGRIGA
jgi:hypothetical protein